MFYRKEILPVRLCCYRPSEEDLERLHCTLATVWYVISSFIVYSLNSWCRPWKPGGLSISFFHHSLFLGKCLYYFFALDYRGQSSKSISVLCGSAAIVLQKKSKSGARCYRFCAQCYSIFVKTGQRLGSIVHKHTNIVLQISVNKNSNVFHNTVGWFGRFFSIHLYVLLCWTFAAYFLSDWQSQNILAMLH